jgi:hypothetical protein
MFRGAKLADSLDVMSWYSGKIDIRDYLKSLNSEKKVAYPLCALKNRN